MLGYYARTLFIGPSECVLLYMAVTRFKPFNCRVLLRYRNATGRDGCRALIWRYSPHVSYEHLGPIRSGGRRGMVGSGAASGCSVRAQVRSATDCSPTTHSRQCEITRAVQDFVKRETAACTKAGSPSWSNHRLGRTPLRGRYPQRRKKSPDSSMTWPRIGPLVSSPKQMVLKKRCAQLWIRWTQARPRAS